MKIKSWKTSLAGVLTVLPQVLHALFPKFISETVATAISTLILAAGLTAAKDHDVTGNPAVTVGEDVPDKTAKTN